MKSIDCLSQSLRRGSLLSLFFLLSSFFCLGAQETPAEKVLVLERNVRSIARDPVQRQREIRRRERMTIGRDRMTIEDLTFQMTWIFRGDVEKLWIIDRAAGRYSEIPFSSIRQRQEALARELESCAGRVKGTEDEKEIEGILRGMGRWKVPLTVEVKEGASARILDRECREKDVVINGENHPVRVFVAPDTPEAGVYFGLLSRIGAFPPEVAAQLEKLGGIPFRGTLRYLLLVDRIAEEVEVTSMDRVAPPAGCFEEPSGLTRTEWPGFEREEERKAELPGKTEEP